MEGTSIEIAVKGITTTITFDIRTAKLYQDQILAWYQEYPNDFAAYAARFGLAMLVFCGYYIHCQDTDMPLIYAIEDFMEWSIQQAETDPGVNMINNITELYLKLAEG